MLTHRTVTEPLNSPYFCQEKVAKHTGLSSSERCLTLHIIRHRPEDENSKL